MILVCRRLILSMILIDCAFSGRDALRRTLSSALLVSTSLGAGFF